MQLLTADVRVLAPTCAVARQNDTLVIGLTAQGNDAARVDKDEAYRLLNVLEAFIGGPFEQPVEETT